MTLIWKVWLHKVTPIITITFPSLSLPAACEGTLSCSTCHLIVDKEWFDKIPDPLTEEEEDMLDLAFGLTDT